MVGGAPLLGIAALAAAAGACVARDGFRCEASAQCVSAAGSGECTAAGYCGFADPSCPDGLRYGSEAPGALADQCVGEVGDGDAAPGDDGAVADAPTGGDGGGAPDADPTALVTYEPSSIDVALLTAGGGAIACDGDDVAITIDTDAGTVTRDADDADLLPAAAEVSVETQPGGPDLRVFAIASLTIASGCTARVVGEAALVFAVDGSVSIGGVLDASGGRGSIAVAGPGGFEGGTAVHPAGWGPGGGAAPGGESGSVGGGGAGHAGGGGQGGDRAGPPGAIGGSVVGVASLVPLRGGSGGSAGGTSGSGQQGDGGGGGGAVQISARGDIAVAGAITTGGGGGGGAPAEDAGGGGGAGGAILLEGRAIDVTGVLACNGGGGGAGAPSSAASGDDGEGGHVGDARASGGVASALGTAGGEGGAGATLAGEDGVDAPGIGQNAGGGGGGAGRIRLRSDAITRPGITSPSAATTEAPL